MASIQSTQKYMNIMAAALQIVTKIPQTFNEIFASQDYEEISTFVTTTLDAYWNDDNYSLLHNIDDFLQTIHEEKDSNRQQIMAISFCLWLDFRITYTRDENNIAGKRAYFSLASLVSISKDDYAVVDSLNTNYNKTGIWINPKFPIATPHIIRNEELFKKNISNRDIFEGINGLLKHCSYVLYDNKNIIKNIIISDTFLTEKDDCSFSIGFSPMSDRKDLLQLEDQPIERNGIKFNGELVKPLNHAEELLERLKNDWNLAADMNVDIFFAPELLGTSLSEKNDGEYNSFLWECSNLRLVSGKNVPLLTILPSYWSNNYNRSTIVSLDGQIIGHQEKHIPFIDKKAHKMEALAEIQEWSTILIHIPNVHRIAIVICAEFLSDQDRIQKFLCGSLGATLLIVPSYSRGEQDFINTLPVLKCYGTTIIWGNCCGAVASNEKAIGGCGIAGTTQTITFGSKCCCNFSCQNIKACVFKVKIPLDFELSKTTESFSKDNVTHNIQ